MRIIIPMSGVGQRFIDAGYRLPKPLIEVDGKPMVEHVVNLFPEETKITFICNSRHLVETDLKSVLQRIAPSADIVEIPPHKKGPVYAISLMFDRIDDDDEIIVNYCDFSKYWSYRDFLNHTRGRNADGAISAYRGFHPHMLGTTNYAFMRARDQWMIEIREKQPFTDNRMQEYASDGTYYFRRGATVKKYFRQLMDLDVHVNGEYYVSMVYNLLHRDGLCVSIYEIEHMLQWGSPRDLEEYQAWSDHFRSVIERKPELDPLPGSLNLIPLAGRGMRFAREGFSLPKPLIEVSGRPMVVQAARSLPRAEGNIFVCLNEHLRAYPLEQGIREAYPDAKIVAIREVTEGQACTCELGLDGADPESPLLIGACDNGMIWNREAYQRLLDDGSVDAIVFSFRRHPSSERNPEMYGWIAVKENIVTSVSVKKPLSSDPYNDHAIVGTFFFRKIASFLEGLRRMREKNIRINNEFYVDSLINELVAMDLRVAVFEVDSYICWGTPNDLRTFEYWQSFFHKCAWHPYDLAADSAVPAESVEALKKRYGRHERGCP